MNKTTITILLVVLAIGGLMWWGRSTQPSSAAVPGSPSHQTSVLTTGETFYNFGTISMKDGLVNHMFKVMNSSGKNVEVKTVNTSCMCTSAYMESALGEKGPFGMPGMGYVPPANERIKAGESRNIRVVYDPNAHGPAGVGSIDRFVYVTDENGGIVQFEIKAMVTP